MQGRPEDRLCKWMYEGGNTPVSPRAVKDILGIEGRSPHLLHDTGDLREPSKKTCNSGSRKECRAFHEVII
eukprot:XP_001706365.1 Hypothetical protein GL50803_37595 [Giardia lamblia ATCC 50803]